VPPRSKEKTPTMGPVPQCGKAGSHTKPNKRRPAEYDRSAARRCVLELFPPPKLPQAGDTSGTRAAQVPKRPARGRDNGRAPLGRRLAGSPLLGFCRPKDFSKAARTRTLSGRYNVGPSPPTKPIGQRHGRYRFSCEFVGKNHARPGPRRTAISRGSWPAEVKCRGARGFRRPYRCL